MDVGVIQQAYGQWLTIQARTILAGPSFPGILLYTTAAEVLLKERLESRETQRQERMMNRWLVIGTC